MDGYGRYLVERTSALRYWCRESEAVLRPRVLIKVTLLSQAKGWAMMAMKMTKRMTTILIGKRVTTTTRPLVLAKLISLKITRRLSSVLLPRWAEAVGL